MKKYLLLILIAVAFLFQSCSMYQKIHFNKDFSGEFRMEVDMTEALSFMMMMDTTGMMDESDLMMEMFGAIDSMGLREEYEKIDGITDVFIEPINETGFVIAYQFKDLESLNSSQTQLNETLGNMGSGLGGEDMTFDVNQSPEKVEPFRLDKKTLTHMSEPAGDSPLGGMGEMDELGGADMLGGMGDLMTIKMDYEFDRKIKNVEATGLVIEKQDKHFVSTKLDFEQMMNDPTYKISFKLK